MALVVPNFVAPDQRQDRRKDQEVRSLRALLTRRNVDKTKVHEIALKLRGGTINTVAVTVFSLRGLCDVFHEGDPAACEKVLRWFYDLHVDEDTAKLILGQPDKKRKRVVIFGRDAARQRALQRPRTDAGRPSGIDDDCDEDGDEGQANGSPDVLLDATDSTPVKQETPPPRPCHPQASGECREVGQCLHSAPAAAYGWQGRYSGELQEARGRGPF